MALLVCCMWLRMAAAQSASTAIQVSEQSSAIHGVVLNASTNRPVARALVQVAQEALLTGPDGRFEFSGLGGTAISVRVTKPGFYEGLDPYGTATKMATVGSADEVQIRMYPEALITGTVMSAKGDPLTSISVQALRQVNDELGLKWIMSGQTTTNADGEFRLPLPGGEYVIETQYAQERPGGRGAILPVRAPAVDSTIHLMSGSEQRLELRPPVRPSHAVHIQVDSADGQTGGQNASQIQAHLANGLAFSPVTHPGDRQGEVVVNLPNGSYLLSASTGNRNDAASYGETKVTVADEDISGVAIHLQKAVELTIEASTDAASETAMTATASPAAVASGSGDLSTTLARQVGIFLQRTDDGVKLGQDDVSPTARRGEPLSFSLLPGRYRLRATSYSAWFVASANAGGTDMLAQDLVLDGGSSSEPLRLVVSNQTATMKGTVKLGGQPVAGYVYLLAGAPSATPVVNARAGNDGGFSRMFLPPGNYRVVASETRLYFDLTSPAAQRQLAPYTKTVTVAAGETGSVDLDAMPSSEPKP